MSYLQTTYQAAFDRNKALAAARAKREAAEQQNKSNNNNNNSNTSRYDFTDNTVLTDLNAPTPAQPSLALPIRFTDSNLYSSGSFATLVPQHPLYQTSSQLIGYRAPAQQELPKKYYANSHTFSDTFNGGMVRDFGLNTSMNKTRVVNNPQMGFL